MTSKTILKYPLTHDLSFQVLFIDEVHMLDIECFSFLNRALESELAPLVVMASNRGITQIRGTSYQSPHGIPLDLLDRVLIISTNKYSDEEIKEIIRVRLVARILTWQKVLLKLTYDICYDRAQEEDVKFEDDALDSLTQIGATCSLRYALNLIGPSSLASARRKATIVAVEDVRTAFGLFADTQRSLQFIEEQQDLMMFGQKKAVDTSDAMVMD